MFPKNWRIKNTLLQLFLIASLLLGLSTCSDKNEQKDVEQSYKMQTIPDAVNSVTNPPQAQTKEPLAETASLVKASSIEETTLNVIDISERNKAGRNGIAVMFSHPLDLSRNLDTFFEITYDEDQPADGAWIIDDSGKTAWFTHTEPRTTYKVTIAPGLAAANGTTLLNYENAKITTRALPPSVSFESQGAILPLGYASGLPVVTVDVAEIDIDFFRIHDKQLATFFEETRYGERNGWHAQRLKQLGELSFSARFQLDAAKHTRTSLDIDLSGFKELETPGIYLAVMRQAGEYNQRQLTWFSITNIGMHLRQYEGQWDVHLASLTTGAPLSGVTVKALDTKSGVLFEQQSDETGLVRLQPRDQEVRALVAVTDKQYTSLNIRQPALDLTDFELGSRPFKPMELFLYGPRDLYRPGERIVVKGLLRDHDGRNTHNALNHNPVLDAQFISPTQSTRHAYRWQSTQNGYYEYEWHIPNDAKTGLWALQVALPNQQNETFQFHVEDFLPERLKLDIANAANRTVLKAKADKLTVPIQAEYLYGAPADGNRLSALLNVQLWRTSVESFKGFYFGNIQEQGYDPRHELKDQTLDKDGKKSLAIKNTWANAQSPLRILLTASVYESGGRAVNRSHSILYWPFKYIIGIRPHFGDANPSNNSVVKFDLVNVGHDGKHAEATKIELNLIKEDRQYFWEFNDHRGWHWDWNEKEFGVEQKTIDLSEAQTVSFPVEWGHYRLEAKNPQTGQISSVRFYAGNNWYSDWQNNSNAAPRPDKISLALDQPAYQPGDIAVLNILPPSAGEVLVLLESDKPLWSTKVSVPQQGLDLNIPIDPNWHQHNIYVSAMLIQPTGQNVTITPKRSLGLIHLPLNRIERKLSVTLDAPEKTKPLQELPVNIQVNNAELNQPIFVNIFGVDVGILNITDYKTPNPFDFFFGQRRYGIDMKDMYADIVEPNNYAKARFQFGGDRDIARGGAAPRSDVRIVSLHSDLIELDDTGKASVPLSLPDFNGRLRLMAIAHSANRFGQQEKEITLASDLIADLSMPRFLATGDRSKLALDLRNMTEESRTATVTIAVSGAGKLSAQSLTQQTLKLKPSEKQTLHFDVEATNVRGQAIVEVTTQLTNESGKQKPLSRTWRIGVRPAYPALTRQQTAVLEKGETFVLDQARLNKLRLSTTQARVQVSSAVDLRMADQLENLLQYPYGCLEQTTSRALPLLYADDAMQTQFKLKAMKNSERKEHIRKAIDRVLGFQKSNGAFSLWSRNSSEAHWLTAYATFFLLEARKRGFQIPDTAIDKALQRLDYYLKRSGTLSRQRWSNDAKHYAFTVKAFSAYILSDLRRAPLGTLRTLYQKEMKYANSGLSQLWLSIALRNMGDVKLADKAQKTALNNLPEEFAYWGDYGSDIRDISAMVQLLLKHELNTKAASALAVRLRDTLYTKEWLSTQEQVMLFMAGIQLQKNQGGNWTANWQMADQQEKIQGRGTFSKILYGNDLTNNVSIESTATQPLYVNALINGHSLSPPDPESKGLTIERRWYTLDGKPSLPQKVLTGDAFIVRLTVNADQRTPDALIVDFLPAGFELENQNVGEALDLQQLKLDGKTMNDWLKEADIQHQAYRDDRYLAALNLQKNRAADVFYLVRAVTPGTFTVPAPMVEDMYRPYLRAIGASQKSITVQQPE